MTEKELSPECLFLRHRRIEIVGPVVFRLRVTQQQPVYQVDVFGFFFGSQFGRSRIAPNVSPNKSVEGTVAGILASIVLGALIVGRITPWSTWHGFLLGLFVGFAALFGDLSESMLKRDLGLKDFGTLLPGHGGVLDRFDALLFCLPVAYYLAVYLKIG